MIAAVAVAVTATRLEAARNLQEGTLIHLADGDVQGEVNGETRQFLGIPYAAPPVIPFPSRAFPVISTMPTSSPRSRTWSSSRSTTG